ncbi:hypothetical protein ACFL6G_03065 [candidate division KSB1 bacterium]
MKFSKIILLLILSSLFLVSAFGFRYQNDGGNTKEERKNEATVFRQKYKENIKVNWREQAGTPSSILKMNIGKYKGSPEDKAMAFLTDEKKMFGINNPSKNLRIMKINSTTDGNHAVIFEQVYKDIPVIKAGYLVSIRPSGAIDYLNGAYFPDIKIDTKPSLDASDVESIVLNDLLNFGSKKNKSTELKIYVSNRNTINEKYNLVFESIWKTTNPIDYFSYIVDAHTGGIIYKNSLTSRVDNVPAKSFLFNPDYDDLRLGELTVYLHNLNAAVGGKYYLNGTYCDVDYAEGDDAESPDADFTEFEWNESSDEFDEVMAYYHINAFNGWLQGLNMPYNEIPKLTVNVNTGGNCTIPADEEIWLSNETDGGWPYNGSWSATVTAHEYVHNLNYQLSRFYSSPNDHEKAMNEAFADYFALAYLNDTLDVDF